MILAYRVTRGFPQQVSLSTLWAAYMPSLTVLTDKGGTRTVVSLANSEPKNTATTVNPVPELADGDIVVLVQTWDGTTVHGYINGVEVITAPWAGSTSDSTPIKLIGWSAPFGGEISIAGLGFQKNEANSAEWARAAYEAAKRGAAA